MKTQTDAASKRLGLIAGWGNYPVLLARILKESGHFVCCLGVSGHADGEALRSICDVYREMGFGRFGTACRFFRKHRVSQAAMAGKIFKKELLRPGVVWRHLPDFYTLSVFFSSFVTRKTDLKDDTLLLAVTRAFEKKGIRLLPGTSLAPELLVPAGPLSNKRLTSSELADVRAAWPLAREIGRLDFGQDVMVRDQTILAVEGIDGTDETIARAGRVSSGNPFTVVKVAKPNQDMRFDVPAVGLDTLDRMARCGAGVLAVEAGRTLCVDPLDEFSARADQLGIGVAAFDEKELGLLPPAPVSSAELAFRPMTKRSIPPSLERNLRFGWPVVRSLSRFGVGRAVTVRERSVIAVSASEESVLDVVRRSSRLAPDGFLLLADASAAGELADAGLFTQPGLRAAAFSVSAPREAEAILAAAESASVNLVEVTERP